MHNVTNLISKSNTKKLRNNLGSEPTKCNCTNKADCPLKGKCQYDWIISISLTKEEFVQITF